MKYDFYIVGKMDNNYILCDAREGMGGKAVTSKYTIKQLVDAGYKVCGYSINDNGRIAITIVNMKGEPAKRVGTFENVPSIARTMSTFEKGIKVSKEEKQKNKTIGEKRSATIQERKSAEKVSDVVEFYRDFVLNNGMAKLTMKRFMTIYNMGLEEKDKVYDFEVSYDAKGNPLPLYYSKEKDKSCRKSFILKKYNEWIEKLALKEGKYVNYTFYANGRPCTPKDVVVYVLNNTTKPILYTHGFEYKSPTIHNVPITKESAIQKLNKDWCDVREYVDCIKVNTYSENDMW